ncbi:hypothetical protein FT663_03122 [Candidozyma haemuli var. vulneris]|nr:hypothetical protein FT662_04179 [[Candida] haemuloni var. vulneris]KAF3990563.1 hypothetical protein FT663_03122 [[Candida] haemuloni var. vulneris]
MLLIQRSIGASLRGSVSLPTARAFSVSTKAFNRYKQIESAHRSPELLALNKEDITIDTLSQVKAFEPKIVKAFKKLGYESFTPVQARSIVPMMTEENGVVCRAKTGTGKTMAFVIPTLQTTLDYSFENKGGRGKVHTLVIAPTRDLAMQIKAEYHKLLDNERGLRTRVQLCIGGTSDRIISAPGIVIATPGRLEANLRNPSFASLFSDLKYRVYDEADRLLDQGFEESLMNIDDMLRDAREGGLHKATKMRSVLFSATVDERVDSFAKATMGEDYRYINCVSKDEQEAHENINQTLIKTKNNYESHVAAFADMFRNLKEKPGYKAIMFVPTVSGTDFLYNILRGGASAGFVDRRTLRNSSLLKLHGKLSQGRRNKSTEEFRNCKSGILICTDVAARGMDFKNVTDVIQICPSSEIADYVHKVGRTARAGTSGNATLYLSEYELPYAQALRHSRGINFSTEVDYENMTEDVALFEKINLYEADIEDYVKSYLGFARGACAPYNLNKQAMVSNVANLYRSFLQDPAAKIHMSSKTFLQMGLRDPRGEFFDIPGGIPNQRSDSRGSKGGFRGGYGRNQRTDRHRSDRHGSDGYRSGGQKYGGYKSDRYSDRFDSRRNDRNSKRTFDSRY